VWELLEGWLKSSKRIGPRPLDTPKLAGVRAA
jgi:hypothetical protein